MLAATLMAYKTGGSQLERIVIVNCASVPIKHVQWEFVSDAHGWDFIDKDLSTYDVLEPGDKFAIPLVSSCGRPAQVKLLLRGLANRRAYQNQAMLSVYDVVDV